MNKLSKPELWLKAVCDVQKSFMSYITIVSRNGDSLLQLQHRVSYERSVESERKVRIKYEDLVLGR